MPESGLIYKICFTYKILSNILNERLKPYTKAYQGEYQVDFRPDITSINQFSPHVEFLENPGK